MRSAPPISRPIPIASGSNSTTDGATNLSPVVELAGVRGSALVITSATHNPFGGQAVLTLSADKAQHVLAALSDALGREVAILYDGSGALSMGGARLTAGICVARAQGEAVSARRMVTRARQR